MGSIVQLRTEKVAHELVGRLAADVVARAGLHHAAPVEDDEVPGKLAGLAQVERRYQRLERQRLVKLIAGAPEHPAADGAAR